MSAAGMTGADADAPANHPDAARMAVLAGLSFNIIIGTSIGSFGVLVRSVQERLHATPEMSTAAIPLLIVVSSLLASVGGVLAARVPLRWLMAGSAALAAAGWLLLAFTASYAVYLAVYALLLGPALAAGGAVLPATLVTRWFGRHRGLALGLVHLPILVAALPLACNWTLDRYGSTFTYLMLAALCGLVLLPASLLVRDRPPEAADPAGAIPPAAQLGVAALLAKPRYWALVLAVAAINTSSTVLGAHLVPMARAWGFDSTRAALLASVMSLAGMAGSILFGWVSDRIGGGRTLALLAFDAGLLWLLFLPGLTFVPLALAVALIGLHGAGAIPALSRGIAELLGPDNFSRAYGLSVTLSLPINVAGVMGTARVYQQSGGYAPAILAMAAYFAIATLLGLYAARRPAPAAALA